MSTHSIVKIIDTRTRCILKNLLSLGAIGRYLVRRYFWNDWDIDVIGSDTNYWVYSAWISYLEDKGCLPKEPSPLHKALANTVEYIDLYLPFEDMEGLTHKFQTLGRHDPDYLSYLKTFYTKLDKVDYADEIEYLDDYYYDCIDDLRILFEKCFKERKTIVIWTP